LYLKPLTRAPDSFPKRGGLRNTASQGSMDEYMYVQVYICILCTSRACHLQIRPFYNRGYTYIHTDVTPPPFLAAVINFPLVVSIMIRRDRKICGRSSQEKGTFPVQKLMLKPWKKTCKYQISIPFSFGKKQPKKCKYSILKLLTN
jgi:hypothetical protein